MLIKTKELSQLYKAFLKKFWYNYIHKRSFDQLTYFKAILI